MCIQRMKAEEKNLDFNVQFINISSNVDVDY